LGRKPLSIERELFLDRTHGGRLIALLRELGFAVNPIKEIYPNGKDQFIRDPEWIKLCGEKNWIILSGDKRLETVPENRQAVIDARAKVFLFMDSESFPQEWAAAVIVGHDRMKEILDANPGPFFVNISKRTGSHLARLRLPHGYEPPTRAVDQVIATRTQVESIASPLANDNRPASAEDKDLSTAKPGNLFPPSS
jgi:PIN like domain